MGLRIRYQFPVYPRVPSPRPFCLARRLPSPCFASPGVLWVPLSSGSRTSRTLRPSFLNTPFPPLPPLPPSPFPSGSSLHIPGCPASPPGSPPSLLHVLLHSCALLCTHPTALCAGIRLPSPHSSGHSRVRWGRSRILPSVVSGSLGMKQYAPPTGKREGGKGWRTKEKVRGRRKSDPWCYVSTVSWMQPSIGCLL